ncbi:MAG: hypothetical protein COT17_03995 [Elusimicrobia bacterium CG08_land_8_20_14_0_20_51_18]|nr:MAG: hypothetical protein COT17_03995 [Elusimicrobia bacterium CG08_land_8_20_14_0_20_51_18]
MKTYPFSGLFFMLFFPAIQSFAGWYDAGFHPRVEMEYVITLSSAMETALKWYDPEFEIWSPRDFHPMVRGLYEYKSFEPWRDFLAYQTPSAVIGDFNGDEVPDAVLMGHNKTQGKTIAIISKEGKYTLVEINSGPLKNPLAPEYARGDNNIEDYMELVPPGKIKAEPAYNRPELDLKTDAFKTVVFEKCGSIHIYKDGKFEDYALSD